MTIKKKKTDGKVAVTCNAVVYDGPNNFAVSFTGESNEQVVIEVADPERFVPGTVYTLTVE